jgi:hypothetical protein
MRPFFGGKSIMGLALVCALLAPVCQAQSSTSLDKHARKVQKTLTKYPAGSYLHVTLRDRTQSSGTLGALSATSFSITNADTNAAETHLFSDVAEVQKGKAFIGKGSVHQHHFHFPFFWRR